MPVREKKFFAANRRGGCSLVFRRREMDERRHGDMRSDGAENLESGGELAEAIARYLERAEGREEANAATSDLSGAETAAKEALAVERILREAFLRAKPSDSFASKVMAELPRRGSVHPAACERASEPRAEPAIPTRVFASESGGRRNTALALASAAVLAVIVGMGWLALTRFRYGRDPLQAGVGEVCRPLPVVGRGMVLGGDGAPVQRIESGKSYRVPPFCDAVLRLRGDGAVSLVKIAKESEFDVPEPGARPALNLRRGTLYAYEPGNSPLVLRSEAMEAEVNGLTMIFREASGPDLPADEGWGQGLIVVLKGSAIVRDAGLEGEIFVDEGRLYVAGFPVEAWTEFVGRAEERARDMEKSTAARAAESRRTDRNLYARTVENYRRDLAAFDAAMAAAAGSAERDSIEERKRRVQRLLEAHERRLAAFSTGDTGEPPVARAKRLRRAAATVRERCREDIDPRTWM